MGKPSSDIEQHIDSMIERKIQYLLNDIRIRITELEKTTQSDMSNAGTPWTVYQDITLERCFEDFLKQMAQLHRRSVGAIEARIKHLVRR